MKEAFLALLRIHLGVMYVQKTLMDVDDVSLA
jgi:hypothetical protein